MGKTGNVERILNVTSAVITIITFLLSFYPTFSKTAIDFPYFFKERLSLFRFFSSGCIIIFCNYGISYFCSYFLRESEKIVRVNRTFFYCLFTLMLGWINFSVIQYVLFDTFFNNNWDILLFTVLLLVTIIFFNYFLRRFNYKQAYNEIDIENDIWYLIGFFYFIMWVLTIFF